MFSRELKRGAALLSGGVARATIGNRVEQARAGERRHLRCALHDTTLQTLEYLGNDGYDSGLVREEIVALAERALRDLHNALDDPGCDPVELLPGLRQVVDESSVTAGLKIELVTGEIDESVHGEEAAALVAAVREALNNVRKHARAQRVVVRCEASEGAARITVHDDGVGFDPASAPKASAWSAASPTGSPSTEAARDCTARPAAECSSHSRCPDLGGRDMKINVLVADDHPLIREGIVRSLEQDPAIEIVGQATDGEEALALARELKPDVLVLDMHMPGIGGTVVLERLREEMPDIRVLVVTASESPERLLDAVAGGAAGYLSKRTSAEDLRQAVITTHGGGSVIEPQLAHHLLREYSSGRRGESSALRPLLGPREVEILRLVARATPTTRSARSCTSRRAPCRTTSPASATRPACAAAPSWPAGPSSARSPDALTARA